MGNTVSAHIYEIKVFRLVEKNWCPSERPKYSMVRQSMGNTVSAHIYEIKVFR